MRIVKRLAIIALACLLFGQVDAQKGGGGATKITAPAVGTTDNAPAPTATGSDQPTPAATDSSNPSPTDSTQTSKG